MPTHRRRVGDTLAPSMTSDAERQLLETHDPLLGQVIQDRYRVIRPLGEGGMGRVYEAEHTLVKRRVAIKCLHAQYAINGEVLGRFLREAQSASSIGNEHIVDVLDMGRLTDGAPFMALEFLEGRDLAKTLQEDGPMSIGRAARIVRQVCEAASAAHAKGIVHRDLKPENIFLIERGGSTDFVKVLDFGIAKVLAGDGSAARTGTGVMVGTPQYMAPEQIEDSKSVDHRADLYAIGGILFASLAGRPVFQSGSVAKLAYEVCMVPPPSILDLRADVPPTLAALVERLLAKLPGDRPQSAREVGEALGAFVALDAPPAPGLVAALPSFGSIANSKTEHATPAPTRAPSLVARVDAPSRRVARAAMAAMVVVALALVGGIVALATRRTPAPPAPCHPTTVVVPSAPTAVEPPAAPVVAPLVVPPTPATSASPALVGVAPEEASTPELRPHGHGHHGASATRATAAQGSPTVAPAPAASTSPARPAAPSAPTTPTAAPHGRLLDITLDPH